MIVDKELELLLASSCRSSQWLAAHKDVSNNDLVSGIGIFLIGRTYPNLNRKVKATFHLDQNCTTERSTGFPRQRQATSDSGLDSGLHRAPLQYTSQGILGL